MTQPQGNRPERRLAIQWADGTKEYIWVRHKDQDQRDHEAFIKDSQAVSDE